MTGFQVQFNVQCATGTIFWKKQGVERTAFIQAIRGCNHFNNRFNNESCRLAASEGYLKAQHKKGRWVQGGYKFVIREGNFWESWNLVHILRTSIHYFSANFNSLSRTVIDLWSWNGSISPVEKWRQNKGFCIHRDLSQKPLNGQKFCNKQKTRIYQ